MKIPESIKAWRKIKTFLGLKGSWGWACRQMDKGLMVYRTTDTGAAKYRTDGEGQRRIQWEHTCNLETHNNWTNAYIFLSDFECTEWAVWYGN